MSRKATHSSRADAIRARKRFDAIGTPNHRFGVLLALLGLVLQIALSTAHSARHFDHLVSFAAGADHQVASAGQLPRDPAIPKPNAPVIPDLDHCAVGLTLAAAGTVVLVALGLVLPEPVCTLAALEAATSFAGPSSRRHALALARAPPLNEIRA
jgi:hypothetical protein